MPKWVWIVFATFLGLFILDSLYVWRLQKSLREHGNEDLVQVISGTVAEIYKKDPLSTPAAIDEALREMISAGRLTAELDRDQRPVDIYGTPFRVRHEEVGRRHKVTATSAGPDRQFDTPDDIRREATWETPAPPSKQ
jgi:hypothetical protein